MSRTLLLADDSVTIQRVIALIFADEDVEVVTVSDGDQAISCLESSPPDIVLADIGMPGRNGYEVAQFVKQSPRLAHIPVLLLTGAFEPADQDRIAASGCDGVLGKPFEPHEVITRVKELLGRDSGRKHLDAYFDRLDQDLTSLANAKQEPRRNPLPQAETEAPATPHVSALSGARTSSPLADAFAALLAAEEQESVSGAPPALPVWRAPSTDGPLATDDLVERVTERVLERLSDRAVRDSAADIVSRIAERLVREEIERIKSSIK
jgi:CheY-like chemotaxis protein